MARRVQLATPAAAAHPGAIFDGVRRILDGVQRIFKRQRKWKEGIEAGRQRGRQTGRQAGRPRQASNKEGRHPGGCRLNTSDADDEQLYV